MASSSTFLDLASCVPSPFSTALFPLPLLMTAIAGVRPESEAVCQACPQAPLLRRPRQVLPHVTVVPYILNYKDNVYDLKARLSAKRALTHLFFDDLDKSTLM